MNPEDLKLNAEYWCWWMHRILVYKGGISNSSYQFEDFGDETFFLSKADVHDLEICTRYTRKETT